MKKNIAGLLMGCGGVGRQLLQHIVSCRSLYAHQGLHLRVVGVCDSSSLVVSSDVSTGQLDDSLLSEICEAKTKGLALSALEHLNGCLVYSDLEFRNRVMDIASLLSNSTGLAFVDCSASSETIGMLTRAVDLGCCIVLANKKPLTSTMKDYEKLVSYPRRIRHEYTVGAGLPVIASLTRLIMSGDTVNRVIGSLSGTLGYVMSEDEDGKLLSDLLWLLKVWDSLNQILVMI